MGRNSSLQIRTGATSAYGASTCGQTNFDMSILLLVFALCGYAGVISFSENVNRHHGIKGEIMWWQQFWGRTEEEGVQCAINMAKMKNTTVKMYAVLPVQTWDACWFLHTAAFQQM
jgi:hypothetical protein